MRLDVQIVSNKCAGNAKLNSPNERDKLTDVSDVLFVSVLKWLTNGL